MTGNDIVHTSYKAKKSLDLINSETGEHLIPKYESFSLNYVQYFDAPRAMDAAGYPVDKKTSKQIQAAFRAVMRKEDVQIRIQSLIREKAMLLGVGSDWVVMKWMELLSRCMQETQVLDRDGAHTGEWKYESRAAHDILDSMAKYFGMYAKGDNKGRPVQVNVNFGGRDDKPSASPVAIDGDTVTING